MNEVIISKITNMLFDINSVTVQTQSSSTGSLLRKMWFTQKRELVSSQLQTHFQPQRQFLIFSYHKRFCSEQTGVFYRPNQKGYRGKGGFLPFCSFPGCPVDISLLCGHSNHSSHSWSPQAMLLRSLQRGLHLSQTIPLVTVNIVRWKRW